MASFNYTVNVTGDCSHSSVGVISVQPYGGTPPYTIEWYDPSLPPAQIDNDVPSIRTGVQYGTYSLRLNDSTLPINNEFYINVPVSSGVCTNIVSVQNTTCGLNNGSVILGSSSLYSSTIFYLYSGNSTYITSATTTNQSDLTIGNLTAGTYYVTVLDLGGCTGKSQNFIVEESDIMDYGLYSVPNSSCGGTPIGKIYVTGLTGNPPFTYLWNNGAITSSITGLTAGVYSVQVTDGYGCNLSQSATVDTVNPIGLGIFTSIPPTCFSNDGSLSLTITGGTAPYYYSASTGNVLISYSQTYTLSGLSSGNYSFQVTDAGLCTILVGTSLATPQGIASVNVTAQNSTCSSTNGQITVSVVGGVSPYSYTLIYPDGNSLTISNSQTSQLFTNLVTGTYTIGVQDNSGCNYIQEATIYAENKFTISTEITGTTCNQNNGTVLVIASTGGELPYDYSLDGLVNVIDTNLNQITFTNVSSGQHNVTVTDASGCVQSSQIYVPSSQPLDFSLYSTSCGNGNSGSITTFINSGTAPFTFNWSDNVPNNPQQIQVTGLTAGTYSVTVTDNYGCSLKRTTIIDCATNYTSFQTYVMGSEVFNIQSPTKCSLLQMMNEGYLDLTSGNTNCNLISATFTAKVSVNPLGLSTSNTFFTSTSLITAPADNLWYDTIKNLLLSVSGVGNVIINQLNNQITIETIKGDNSLSGQEIIIELVIVYDIMCLT